MALPEYRLARTRSALSLRRSSSASRVPLSRSSSLVSLPPIHNRPPYNTPSPRYYPHSHYRGSRLFDDYTHYEPLYYRTHYPSVSVYDSYRAKYNPYYLWSTPSHRSYWWRPRYSIYSSSAYNSNFVDPYYNWYNRSAYYSPYRPSLFDDYRWPLNSPYQQKYLSHRRSALWDSVRLTPSNSSEHVNWK